MSSKIRVLVAEDNEDLREAVMLLLNESADIFCVAATGSLEQIVPLGLQTSPDVIVLDLELQGRSSLPSLPALRAQLAQSRFVIYSGHAHPELMRAAIAAGAVAYVTKSGDFDALIGAIRSAYPA